MHLTKVLIRISPPEQVRPAAVSHKPRMSSTTAGLLRQVANTLDDPALGAALRRLALNYKRQ
jgi:hypothetical protein